MVIPSGPLRESLDVLKDVQVAIINGGKSKNSRIRYCNITKT